MPSLPPVSNTSTPANVVADIVLASIEYGPLGRHRLPAHGRAQVVMSTQEYAHRVVMSTSGVYGDGMKHARLSTRELAIWHAFKQMGQTVMAAVEKDLAAGAGLTGSDFGVLSRLVDLGKGELRQQALADSMGWHKSRLSHQLTRMQARGLVRRNGSEPRVVTVAITALGEDKIAAARSVHATSVRTRLLDRLSTEDAQTLLKLAATLGADQH
ncbi:MarR family winged helix-turn-helix transcriptional regulator [Xanthomonas indica]|uniref:MarR family winged helix-turn-helix transcriptional regulator n=1 Tax=Xanthomonas indica TaxID=2912242 RepID=A0AAU8IAS7_9XANT|nr:MarR family winged helix-turn-helix transcriptional regulator [Xanthomonas indica]MCI2259996.1 MarR family winged helix-turn-helix transcriptional regulator [Xanthomonas indica]